MAGHTPGPWEWTDVQVRGSYQSGVLRGMFGETPATYPIINAPGVIDGLRVELDAANARLIAAAPDLLTALCNMLEDGDKTDREQAMAAIAKATGQ